MTAIQKAPTHRGFLYGSVADTRRDAGGARQPFSTSKSCVISADLPSMMLAEQYLSADRCTACSTRLGSRLLPVTIGH